MPSRLRPSRPRPEGYVSPETYVIAQAICRGELEQRVLAVSGVAARSGTAHVSIRYGRILLFIEDWAAMEALIRAVDRAEELALQVLGPRDLEAAEDRKRNLRQFERTGRLLRLEKPLSGSLDE